MVCGEVRMVGNGGVVLVELKCLNIRLEHHLVEIPLPFFGKKNQSTYWLFDE
jgi:hypothetical protein